MAPSDVEEYPCEEGGLTEALRDLMTTDEFRRIALSLPGAEESSGLGYPNFRAGRKSFATIENAVAVIRLTRDQQASFMAVTPEMFAPASGGWGRLGSTIVRLEAADEAVLRDALSTAWRNVTDAAADTVKIADAFKVSANVAAVGDGKVADVPDPDGAADVTNVADAAKVEPRDDLRDVIEQLQVYWGERPTR
jgi:hypothetical protein